ncbi:MAG: DUF3570 domain-containing protein [Caldimonas sp.]
MAATDARDKAGAIIAAALALPGVVAYADSAPERGEIAVKYLDYRDSQPGLDRVKVRAPSIYVLAPISPKWAVEGALVYDSVSGATPRYHTAVSGASRMKEERVAGDVKVTRYAERSSYAFGLSHSSEHDYKSTAASFDASFSSDDSNRTWNAGVGYAHDTIGSTNDAALHEKKRTAEVMIGVTQALTANDLLQVNLTANVGRGYYSDPYKEPDIRPRKRDQGIALVRWNHHLADLGSTLRSSYRFYHDSFGINAHTLGLEWVQPVGSMFTLTPSARFYSQSAAKFYFDPVYDTAVGEPYPPGYFTNPPQTISPDQRLSAFGGLTVGLKLAAQLGSDWSFDLKAEHYEQRSSWRLGGNGSPGLDPFRATFLQVGVGKRF